MKILTLNINSIRAHVESFLEILRKGEYDTILVQEIKVENANFPHMLFDEFGYNVSKILYWGCRTMPTQMQDSWNVWLMDVYA